jgi:uncharacterized protein (TIGR03067 family)
MKQSSMENQMKKTTLAAFVALGALTGAQAGDEGALKKELSALEGKWTMVKLVSREKEVQGFKGAALEFLKDGKTFVSTKGNLVSKGIFEVNPATKQKTITLFPPEEKGNVFFGIYKIEKNVMTICGTEHARDGRPTEFALKDGKQLVIVTLERAK